MKKTTMAAAMEQSKHDARGFSPSATLRPGPSLGGLRLQGSEQTQTMVSHLVAQNQNSYSSLCLSLVLTLAAVSVGWAAQPEWRVGVARTDITPSGPIWMGGYAARNHPSEGVLQPIWAKALVFEDQAGSRAAIVALDLIGIGRGLADAVCGRVSQKTGIARQRVVLNCSHTHSGPVVAGVTPIVYDLNPQQQAAVDAYAKNLEDKVVLLVEAAVKDLRPARLAFGEGKATFAANRRAMRVKVPEGAPQPPAPVDHSVPVLVVRDEKDALRAVLFGYACHNTTLGIYQINGDYAGFAQIAVEKAHPGTIGLFMIGCGGDSNPNPRSEVELAEQHGRALAEAVDRTLAGKLHPLAGPLAVAFQQIDLPLVDPPTKDQLQQQAAKGNKYQQRLAKQLLDRLEKNQPIETSCSCPIQVVTFGKDLVMIALAGEVVVDYALRLRKELPGQRLWIASFCNDVFAYVPSERVLKEGGYEGGGAMVYFGLHGPFKPGLEDKIIDTVKNLIAQCRK